MRNYQVHLTENEGDDAEGIEFHSTMSIREISSIFVRDISLCVFLKIVLRHDLSTKAYGSRMSTTKFSIVAKDDEAGSCSWLYLQ